MTAIVRSRGERSNELQKAQALREWLADNLGSPLSFRRTHWTKKVESRATRRVYTPERMEKA